MQEDNNPLSSDVMQNIADLPKDNQKSNILDEEMIPKESVDMYIQDQVNKLFADRVRMEKEQKAAKRKKEESVIEEYTGVMKDSDEPWVDLTGYTETDNGLRISLDWNNAFIEHLRDQGMKGVDDEQIVHTWLSMLMQSVTEQTKNSKGDFEE